MDRVTSLIDRVTGKNKYAANLLGEALPDLLRKATAKTLVTPDETVNQQVVDAIQQEVAGGKDTKEIVSLLKKRLRTDNPQKQWLGILLFQKVMSDCSNVLGMHQEELLQEVARVMARPAKPETEAGKAARHAAKELLRRYGRAGTTAFRAAHQEVYGRGGVPGSMYGAGPYGGYGAAAGYGTPPAGGVAPGYPVGGYPVQGGDAGGGGLSAESQSLAEEVRMLIDKARSNTELLSDMLVNRGGEGAPGGADEFESELIRDLLAEVVELRGLFTAYLEQLQSHEGPEMEVLMVQALEATDLLDGCISLHKDVAAGNQDIAAAAAAAGRPAQAAGAYGGAGTSAGGAPPAAAAAAPAPQPQRHADLIALDDLADGMTAAPPAAPAAHDPFAASMAAPIFPGAEAGGQAAGGQGAGGAPQGAPPMKSAFESMFTQPGAGQAFNAALSGPAPSAAPSQPPPYPAAGQPYYPAQQQQQQPFGQAPQQHQPFGQPPAYAGYGTQQPQVQQAPHNPFGGSTYPGVAAAGYGAPAPAPAGAPAVSNNPFAPVGSAGAGAPTSTMPSMQSSGFLPMPPVGVVTSGGGAQPPRVSNNPFAPLPAQAPAPAPAAPHQQQGGGMPSTGQTSVDQEWAMFFADRAAGAQAAAAAAHPAPAHVHAEFDALVAKPTAAR